MDIGPFLGELVPHPPLSCEFFKNTLKEREFGLLEKYKTDDQFRKLCGILDRLGFLPPQLVPQELTTREKSTGDIATYWTILIARISTAASVMLLFHLRRHPERILPFA